MNPKITFPRIGYQYTQLISEFFEEMGIQTIVPPPTTKRTIEFGVKHSAELMCYPFKQTLGNLKEGLEKGADTIVMFDSRGTCRFRHYWKLYEHTLRGEGYIFEMVPIKISSISILRKLNPRLSYYHIVRTCWKYWKRISRIDRELRKFDDKKINIGIIGEIWTVLEESANYDINNKLKDMGANACYTVTLSNFLKEHIGYKFHIHIRKRKYWKQTKKYLNGRLGGHGPHNICNLLWLIDQKIDGVIHLLPMSCMPETTIEPILNKICQENKVPLLRLPIDETNSEANISTRLETFVEIIKRKNE